MADLLPVGLATMPHARRGQYLELVAQAVAVRRRRSATAMAARRRRHQDDPTLIGDQGLLLQSSGTQMPSPIAGSSSASANRSRSNFSVAATRAVTADRQPSRSRAIARHGRDRLRLRPTVDIDELAGREDVLHANRYQAAVLLRRLDPLGLAPQGSTSRRCCPSPVASIRIPRFQAGLAATADQLVARPLDGYSATMRRCRVAQWRRSARPPIFVFIDADQGASQVGVHETCVARAGRAP